MRDEIVELQLQVAILQAHLADATGYMAVATHPQLNTCPEHLQCTAKSYC